MAVSTNTADSDGMKSLEVACIVEENSDAGRVEESIVIPKDIAIHGIKVMDAFGISKYDDLELELWVARNVGFLDDPELSVSVANGQSAHEWNGRKLHEYGYQLERADAAAEAARGPSINTQVTMFQEPFHIDEGETLYVGGFAAGRGAGNYITCDWTIYYTER